MNAKKAGFLFSSLLLLSVPAANCQSSFQTLDDPSGSGYTYPLGVSGNDVVGYYLNGGNTIGFLYDGASYSDVNVPGADYTRANGVSGGTIVGMFEVNFNYTYGFIYSGGTYSTLDDPNSDDPSIEPGYTFGTYAQAISGSNVVGYYNDKNGTTHGFKYSGGTFTTLDDPAAAAGPLGGTYPQGISGNTIVGYYGDGTGLTHGFVYNGSSFTTLDNPNGVGATELSGVSGNYIVGTYYGASFLYDGSSFTNITDPNESTSGGYTTVTGISGNTIVGYYLGNDYNVHGFSASIGSSTVIPTPWPDASNLGGGWMNSSWFGKFNVNNYPWIYHQQHGWLYVFGTDPTSIWMWTPDTAVPWTGFVWTGNSVYPWIWSDSQKTWLYYSKGSSNPRYFYNWNAQKWTKLNP